MIREKILNYTKKESKTHLTRYLKYLVKYGDSENINYVNINKNGIMSLCTKYYYVELYDIESLTSFSYEGKVPFNKDNIDSITLLKDATEIKDYLENLMISFEKVYDNRIKKYQKLLTENHKLILDYTLDLNNIKYIENIMTENKDDYHNFFYIDFNDYMPKLRFKLDKYDIISNHNNLINYDRLVYVPYEVLNRMKEIEKMNFKVYKNEYTQENVYELNISFDICKSRILCKIL